MNKSNSRPSVLNRKDTNPITPSKKPNPNFTYSSHNKTLATITSQNHSEINYAVNSGGVSYSELQIIL